MAVTSNGTWVVGVVTGVVVIVIADFAGCCCGEEGDIGCCLRSSLRWVVTGYTWFGQKEEVEKRDGTFGSVTGIVRFYSRIVLAGR